MIYKKYNETQDEKNVYYLKVKGKKYDRDYTLSIQPYEQEKGSAFESMQAYTGVTARLARPTRWTAKREAQYDALVAEYADRLADSFTRGAQEQKDNVQEGKHYVYYADRDASTYALLREIVTRSTLL